jgi:hypothetical protein
MVKHKKNCAYLEDMRSRCTCGAKVLEKPFTHWQEEADRVVVDSLLRAAHSFHEEHASIIHILAERRMRALAEEENARIVEELEEERTTCRRNVAKMPGVYHLGVLKAVVEGDDAGTYFGSTMSLAQYVEETIALGWLTEDGSYPTEEGRLAYREYRLADAPRTRCYMWRLGYHELL